MLDEKVENLTHGFDIHAGEHTHALEYMARHMNEEQVKEMVDRAKNGHSADFMVNHDGQHSNFKLSHTDGKLIIHEVHSH